MRNLYLAVLMFTILLSGAFLQSIVAQEVQERSAPSYIVSLMASIYPQKKVATCSEGNQPFKWGTSDISIDDDQVTMTGADNTGRPYRLVKSVLSVSGCELWEADLAGTGTTSLLLLAHGDDMSGGYDSTLTVLSPDASGTLIPWHATGRFTSNARGITSIVSSSKSKSAVVLVETKEGLANSSPSRSWESYTWAANGVSKTIGAAAGTTWPVVQSATPNLMQHRAAEKLNLAWNSEKAMKAWSGMSPKTGSIYLQKVMLSGGTLFSYPVILVDDTKESRVILFEGSVVPAIQALAKGSHFVAMEGSSCDEDECRPLVMWVR